MKYSDLLNYLKYTVHPNKDKIKKNAIALYKKEANKFIIRFSVFLAFALSLLMIVHSVIMFTPLGKKTSLPENLSANSLITDIQATETADNYISNETAFKITTKKPVSKKTLRGNLKINPETEYKIVKTSGNTFRLSFNSKLKSNTLYSLSSQDASKTAYSWAFQTKTDFEITAHSPDNEAENANQEICIDFSHTNVENFIENFSIKPAISGTFEHYEKRWKFIPSDDYQQNILYTVTINSSVKGGNGEELANDYSFSFINKKQSKIKSKIEFDSPDMISTFRTDMVPNIRISIDDNEYESANVDIYIVPSAEEFIDLHKSHVADDLISSAIYDDIKNLDKYDSFTQEIHWDNNIAEIDYSQTLPKGYYISEITIEDKSFYQPIQITDIKPTIETVNKYKISFIDEVSGTYFQQTEISLSGYPVATIDKNQSVTFPFDFDKNNYKYLIVKTADRQSYVCRINTCPAKSYSDILKNHDKIISNNITFDKSIDFTHTNSDLFSFEISNEIKYTDDAVISVKSEHFDSNNECEYTLELVNNGSVIKTLYGNIQKDEFVNHNLGKLPIGDYNVTVTCLCDASKKTSRDFSIKSSYAVYDYEIKELVENTIILDGSLFSSDANIIFYDEEYEFFRTVANTVLNRSENSLLGDIAFSRLYGDKPTSVQNITIDLSSGQLNDIVDFISVTNDLIDKTSCIQFFDNYLCKTNNDFTKILCYYGLSSLGEPVLNELLTLYSKVDDFNYQEKLYLALGFAYAGDYTTAYSIYNDYISDKIKIVNSTAHFDVPGTVNDVSYLTAITTALCSKISVNNAKDLAKTLINDDLYSKNHSYALINFINNWSTGISAKNKIEIEYENGKKEVISYSKNEVYSKKVNQNDLKNIKITPKNGVSVMTVNGYTESSNIPDIYTKNEDVTENYSDITVDDVKENSVYINFSFNLPDQFNKNIPIKIKLPYSCEFVSCDLDEEDGTCYADGTNITLQLNKNPSKLQIECKSKYNGDFTFEAMYVIDKVNGSYFPVPVGEFYIN